jgi:hypothetical protein
MARVPPGDSNSIRRWAANVNLESWKATQPVQGAGLRWHPSLRLTVAADYATLPVVLKNLPLVHFGE